LFKKVAPNRMALKWSGRWLLGRGYQRPHPLAPDFAVYPRCGLALVATASGTLHRSGPPTHNLTSPTGRCLSTSARCSSLMDFFDDKKNWDKEEFHGGRAWNLQELRIKSNSDLHKLWYILLKQVNMLLTMEEEYRRVQKPYPSPERLDKCEESMENIMQVVRERDEAYNLLETGIKGEPKQEWRYDILGRPFVYTHQEHLVPEHLNEEHEPNPMGYPSDVEKFLWLDRERDLREQKYWENIELKQQRKLKDIWPENEVLKEVPDPEPWKEDFTAGDKPSAIGIRGPDT